MVMGVWKNLGYILMMGLYHILISCPDILSLGNGYLRQRVLWRGLVLGTDLETDSGRYFDVHVCATFGVCSRLWPRLVYITVLWRKGVRIGT